MCFITGGAVLLLLLVLLVLLLQNLLKMSLIFNSIINQPFLELDLELELLSPALLAMVLLVLLVVLVLLLTVFIILVFLLGLGVIGIFALVYNKGNGTRNCLHKYLGSLYSVDTDILNGKSSWVSNSI